MSFTESLEAIVAENRNQLLSKHDSWERVRLGDVVDILNGFPFESSQFSDRGDGTPLIRIRDIVRGTTDTSYIGVYLPEFLIEPGDLLIGMDGDFNCAFWRGETGLLNQRCGKLSVVSECFDGRFLAYCLPGYLAAINAHTSSVTVKHLSSRTVADIPLPLPPEREQSRIADALDELLSDLDAGVKALESVRAKLRQYRAAVLKAAVEGALTAEWRKAHPDVQPASELLKRILAERRRRWEKAQLKKYKDAAKEPPKNWKAKYEEPISPDVTKLPSLPVSWCWATVDQCSRVIQYGTSAKANEINDGGVPVIRMGNIVADGRIDATQLKYLPRDHDEFPALLLEAGDLLFNRTNSAELVGKTGYFRGEPSPCSFASYLIRIRTAELVTPQTVMFALNSAFGRSWIKSVVTQMVGQANVNGSKLAAFSFPLAPLDEQSTIVEAVDDQLSIIEHLESDLEAKLKSAQALRQSILKVAFEGKLVPQDPSDEPASELLKRIAAERAERERLAKQAMKPAKPTKVRGPKRRQNVNAIGTA